MPVPPRTQPVAESVLDTDETPQAALRARPGFPFLLVFYPDDPGNWFIGEVDGVPTWLPKLQRQSLVPGVGGVRTLQTGEDPELRYSLAIEKIRRKGGIVLDRDLDYCFRTPCQDVITGAAGHVYHEAYAAPYVPKGRNKATVKYTVDTDRRDAWLAWLVTEGYVPPPSPEMVETNKARLLNRVHARAERRAVQLPEDLERIEDIEGLPRAIAEAKRAHDVAADAELPAGPEKATRPPEKPTRRRKARTRAKAEKAPTTAQGGTEGDA